MGVSHAQICVDQGDLRLGLPKLRQSRDNVAGSRDDFEVQLLVQQRSELPARQPIVLNQHDPGSGVAWPGRLRGTECILTVGRRAV